MAVLALAFALLMGAWALVVFTVKAVVDKPLKNGFITLLVAAVVSSPFIYNYVEDKQRAQRAAENKKKRAISNAQYAQSNAGLMSCVESFNKQFFLAPAWKKSLPKGHSTTVDVYKQNFDNGARYSFIVPDILKKQSSFWVDADVPHFIKYKGDGPYYSIDEAHFQKGQYIDRRYRFSSVVCNPISSGRRDMLSARMYYIVFDGSLTAKGYEQYRQKLRDVFYDHNKAGIRFKTKHLAEGELFEESRLTAKSPGMEKVYSIKL